jgi:hypothetical protein
MLKKATPFIKRPNPARTGPHRGPETVFRPFSAQLDERRSAFHARNPDVEELEDRQDDDRDDDHDPDDEARLSLDSARLVADKNDPYRARPRDMQRGYEHWSQGAGRRRRGRRSDGDLLDLAGSSTRAMVRLLTVWVDLLGPLLPPALRLGRGGERRLAGHRDEVDDDERRGTGAHHARVEELSVSLEVTSKRPVRVSVEIDRGLAPEPLRVRPLRVPGTKGPAIRGALIDVDGLDRVVVHVVVPDHFPAGSYEGAVLSSDGRTRLGRLRVLVRDAANEPAV